MNRVVLDTNVIVSAVPAPSGTQAAVLLLALTGRIAIYVSPPVLAEYEEVPRRPRLRVQPRQIDAAMAAEADWLVTGNTRHFPQSHGQTKIVAGRRFLDILTESGNPQLG